MAKVRKHKNMTADPSRNSEVEPDIDDEEHPAELSETDADNEDEFEFDMSLLPKGVELVELQPDFVRPEGFLMVPRVNKKTGEIAPMTTTFVGVLHDAIPWKDARGKERFWFSCTATADMPDAYYTGKKEDGDFFVEPVKKGTRVGISSSGAINALKTKKGHLVYLHWTGNKVEVKNGSMWEIKAMISKEPLEKLPF
jgi:hypothetical protein